MTALFVTIKDTVVLFKNVLPVPTQASPVGGCTDNPAAILGLESGSHVLTENELPLAVQLDLPNVSNCNNFICTYRNTLINMPLSTVSINTFK